MTQKYLAPIDCRSLACHSYHSNHSRGIQATTVRNMNKVVCFDVGLYDMLYLAPIDCKRQRDKACL